MGLAQMVGFGIAALCFLVGFVEMSKDATRSMFCFIFGAAAFYFCL